MQTLIITVHILIKTLFVLPFIFLKWRMTMNVLVVIDYAHAVTQIQQSAKYSRRRSYFIEQQRIPHVRDLLRKFHWQQTQNICSRR